jgi:3-(3-hydroxy-phenyl)propionate hydroxylase
VVVVGLGPVGATAALLLAARGVPVVAIEREPQPHGGSRAVALDDTGLSVLEAAGLGAELGGLFAPARTIRFSSRAGDVLLELRPSLTDHGHPELAFFHQPDLERALRSALGRAKGVEVRLRQQVTGLSPGAEGVEVEMADVLSGQRSGLRAAVVLGCDGARSTVRRALGARLRGVSPARRWLVVDTVSEGEAPGRFEFGCDPRRPWVHGTLPDGRHRWEFLLSPDEAAGQLERPESVARLLEGRGHTPSAVGRAGVYLHHARMADRLSGGRVLLLGDAARLSPPFAGQGLSAGLRDASAASWRAAAVTEGRAGPELLAAYGRERRPDSVRVIALALAVGAIVQTRDRRIAAVRDAAIGALWRLPRVRAWAHAGRWRPSRGFSLEPR